MLLNKERREECKCSSIGGRMLQKVLLVLLWLTGIVCIPVMKKLEPEIYRVYTVYVLAIEILTTYLVVSYLSLL